MGSSSAQEGERFDLVVTLRSDVGQSVKLELGDVLLSQGITAAELVMLLNEGRVQLGRSLDFEAANALAQQLEVGGTVVELLEIERPRETGEGAPDVAAAGPAAASDPAPDPAEAGAVDVTMSEFDIGSRAAPASRLPEIVLSTVGDAGAPGAPLDGSVPIEVADRHFAPTAIDPPSAATAIGSAAIAPPAAAAAAPMVSAPADPFAPPPETEEGLALDGPRFAPRLAPSPEPSAAPSTGELSLAVEARPAPPSATPAVDAVPQPRRPPRPAPCPRCGTLVADDDECRTCAAARSARLRRRLFGGSLHKVPPLRLGLGFALGLLIGYVGAAPYSRHVERSVAALQTEANQLRYRPDPELRRSAALLDEQAEDRAQGAAVRVGLLWLGLAALVFLGWMAAT